MNTIKLGDRVRDTLSGFTGAALTLTSAGDGGPSPFRGRGPRAK